MTPEEKQVAEMHAMAIAMKIVLTHLPTAANAVGRAAEQVEGLALALPLTDEQIARMRHVLLSMLPGTTPATIPR